MYRLSITMLMSWSGMLVMANMLSDTSCLIALDNIGQLGILHSLYDTIHICEGEANIVFGR